MFKEFKDHFLKYFVYDDGLAGLHKNDFKTIDGLTYARPDNGVLHVVYAYFFMDASNMLDSDDVVRFRHALNTLKIKPGLYKKRSYNDRLNSIDNLASIVAGSVLFNIEEVPREVCEYGLKHGWHYENVKAPIRSWRQGADVCFYKMSANYNVPIYEFLWFSLSILWSAYKEKPHQTSEHLITWLRLKTILIVKEKNKGSLASPFKFGVIKLLSKLWLKKILKKTNGLGVEYFVIRYFTRDTPIKDLAKGVKF